MSREAKPYFVPASGGLDLGPWQRHDGHAWLPLQDEIPGWDPETDLVLRRDVEADWPAVRSQAGFPSDFPLSISAAWWSSTSQMRMPIGVVAVPTAGRARVEGRIPGRAAGGVLELSTALSTAADWPAAPPAVARWAGSVLLADKARVALEGTGSMFPIAVVDFTHTTLHPEASWHLTRPFDLSAPFLGTFLLSVNERDTELVEALTANRPTAAQTVLVAELHHQVAMTMLELALDAETMDDLLDSSWPPESAGEVLQRLRTAASGRDLPPGELTERRTWLAGVTRRAANGRSLL